MKRIVNTSLFLLFIASLFSMSVKSEPFPLAAIEFEFETIDYGTISKGENGEKIFTFINNGDAPLLITKVKTSCGCTVPKYSKAPINPGDSGVLTVKYNTNRLGRFSKTITVFSNAEGGTKILKIKGNVVAAD